MVRSSQGHGLGAEQRPEKDRHSINSGRDDTGLESTPGAAFPRGGGKTPLPNRLFSAKKGTSARPPPEARQRTAADSPIKNAGPARSPRPRTPPSGPSPARSCQSGEESLAFRLETG